MPIKSTVKRAASRFAFRAQQFTHRARWSADLNTLLGFYRSRPGVRRIRAVLAATPSRSTRS